MSELLQTEVYRTDQQQYTSSLLHLTHIGNLDQAPSTHFRHARGFCSRYFIRGNHVFDKGDMRNLYYLTQHTKWTPATQHTK